MSAASGVRPAWRHASLLMGIIVVAWGLAVGAELSGQAQWVHHHRLVVDGVALWASLALFLVAWQVHIAAMMLPTALPMVGLYRQVAAGQPHPRLARASFLFGYLVVWTAFGLAALLAMALVEGLGAQWPRWHQRPEWLAGGVLVLAGAFQFSALKASCLDKCRAPRAFLLNHYRRGVAGGFAMGLRHGAFCLGCCWALMLVMFVVGIANLAWMAPLAALMLYEKVARHGARLVRPVGVALILLGLLVIVEPAWLPGLTPGPGPHGIHPHGVH